jgi:hypothetical protein
MRPSREEDEEKSNKITQTFFPPLSYSSNSHTLTHAATSEFSFSHFKLNNLTFGCELWKLKLMSLYQPPFCVLPNDNSLCLYLILFIDSSGVVVVVLHSQTLFPATATTTAANSNLGDTFCRCRSVVVPQISFTHSLSK